MNETLSTVINIGALIASVVSFAWVIYAFFFKKKTKKNDKN
jgi:hypothetical protein